MPTAIYSFYLESEAGVPAPDMNPEITLMKVLPGGINVSEDYLGVINLFLRNKGDGIYTFPFDWDAWDESVKDGSNLFVDLVTYDISIKRSLFIKIKTGFESQDQAYISMRIERQDVLPELVDKVQESADSLSSSSESLKTVVDKILSIEEGSWVVRDEKFLVFKKNVALEDMTNANAIYSFDLKDQNGNPTNENPFQRIATGI
jgi:hypothetical protein